MRKVCIAGLPAALRRGLRRARQALRRALRGLGENAAIALEQATIHGQEYISIEELQQASGVAQSILDKLRDVGALGKLPETSQVDFFSMMG